MDDEARRPRCPCETRYARTASARDCDSFMLYASPPTLSVWPWTSRPIFGLSVRTLATSSRILKLMPGLDDGLVELELDLLGDADLLLRHHDERVLLRAARACRRRGRRACSGRSRRRRRPGRRRCPGRGSRPRPGSRRSPRARSGTCRPRRGCRRRRCPGRGSRRRRGSRPCPRARGCTGRASRGCRRRRCPSSIGLRRRPRRTRATVQRSGGLIWKAAWAFGSAFARWRLGVRELRPGRGRCPRTRAGFARWRARAGRTSSRRSSRRRRPSW